MRRMFLFLLFVTIPMVVTPLEAKNREKAWEFGAAITHIDGDHAIPVDNQVGGTLSIGYHITDKMEAEFFLTKSSGSHGEMPNLDNLILRRVTQPRCRPTLGTTDPDPECFQGVVTGVTQAFEDGDEFLRGWFQVTANFLTDRETKTIPYLSGGVGVINETREDFPYVATYETSAPDDFACTGGGADGDNLRETCVNTQSALSPERFDSAFLLTLGAGARTFFNDWFALRYDARYLRHDTFVEGQNEWLVTVGATFVVGGQK